MPLFELNSTEAVENRKNNPVAGWQSRRDVNRVEPVCTPAFDVPFKLVPGEPVFTVGSCFARNVEQELLARGFNLPTRHVLSRPEFQKVEAGVLNNFGTPSIHNEFAWAFGDKPFALDDHIAELAPGKWVDMHLAPLVRPDDREVVAKRREAVVEAYRASAQCRVIIMTLGYVEVWYDTKTGYYLNTTPRPGMLRAEPARFRFRVLSFEETYFHLQATLELIRNHGHPDVRTILTVSPVPIAVTHRDLDVILANTYSKSVLRAAAETACATYDFVAYFPSYESVTISDRKMAWRDDLVHVTPEIVALNVGRMVDAFVGSAHDLASVRNEIELGGLPVALEKARTVPGVSPTDGDDFFAEFAPRFKDSAEFVLLAARHAMARNRPEDALAMLDALPEPMSSSNEVQWGRASAYLAVNRPERAVTIRRNLIESGADATFAAHNNLLVAAEAANDESEMLATLARITARFGSRGALPRVRVGRWYLGRGELSKARTQFEMAIDSDPSLPSAYIALTEVQFGMGERAAARATFSKVRPETPSDVKRVERLRQLIN